MTSLIHIAIGVIVDAAAKQMESHGQAALSLRHFASGNNGINIAQYSLLNNGCYFFLEGAHGPNGLTRKISGCE